MFKSETSYIDSKLPLYCIMLVIMVMVGRIQEIIPGLSVLRLGKVSFIIALILYLSISNKKCFKVSDHIQMRFMAIFVCIGIISTPFSLWVSKSVKFMAFELSALILMIVLLKSFITTYKNMLKIIWVTLLSVALLGFTALIGSNGGRASASGTYDPNDLALVMVTFLPLVFYLMKSERGLSRFFLVGIMCLYFLALMATQSRGGWLGLITVTLLTLINIRVKFGDIVKYSFLISLLLFYFAPEGYWDRISTIFKPSEDYNTSSSGGRIAIWKRGLNEAFDNPLIGVGPAVFAVAEGLSHEDEGGKWSPPHNSFIQVLAEFGIPGFSVYLLMLFFSIRELRHTSVIHSDKNVRNIAKGAEIGFYGFMVCGFFLSQAFSTSLFLLIGFSIVIPTISVPAIDDLV